MLEQFTYRSSIFLTRNIGHQLAASGCLDSSGGTLVIFVMQASFPSMAHYARRTRGVSSTQTNESGVQDAVCQRRLMAQSDQQQPADAVGKDIPQESSACRVTVTSNLHPSQYTETYLPLHVLEIIRREFLRVSFDMRSGTELLYLTPRSAPLLLIYPPLPISLNALTGGRGCEGLSLRQTRPWRPK